MRNLSDDVSKGLEIKTVRFDEKNFLPVLDGRTPDAAGHFRLAAEAPARK